MHASPMSMTHVSNFFPVSLTPVKLSKTVKVSLTGVIDTGKHRNNRISLRIIKKFKIVSGHVYWAQEEQFEEKTRGKKSLGTFPLNKDDWIIRPIRVNEFEKVEQ
jgi:hypothetical protein